MSGAVMNGPCPCSSGKRYAVCCGALHRGQRQARTAEQLMRSRYSAYVLRLEPYLLTTWHPDTRPAALDLQSDTARWLGLQILRTVAGGVGDDSGQVKFIARYRLDGTDHELAEDSRFVRLDGHWTYLDADSAPSGGTASRGSTSRGTATSAR
jgi:SEC-C motif domain protein